jgi:hypothetical protein
MLERVCLSHQNSSVFAGFLSRVGRGVDDHRFHRRDAQT